MRSAQILAFRPTALVVGDAPSSDPGEVLAYLRGLDAGDRHGYARGRREALGDLWRGALRTVTLPLGRWR
ncbi:hypothetical protein [Caulobacter sp. S45]|uniref:hypothetical protein n=1 Tax=Caulobacter sp. S45 TaxID=1641861 RepID=UPI0015766DAC|nr:hypothetical protein [Caulobacter sp. S45]